MAIFNILKMVFIISIDKHAYMAAVLHTAYGTYQINHVYTTAGFAGRQRQGIEEYMHISLLIEYSIIYQSF
jgi:flagellar biosynthesis protein FliR